MLHKEKNKKSIFEDRFKYSVPSESEVRIVTKANEQCFYYLNGIQECRDKVLSNILKENMDEETDFFQCKEVSEAYYRCVTKDQYGKRLEDMEDAVKPYFKNFTSCIFRRLGDIGECRKYHDDILRHYARQENNKLDDIYS